MLLTGAIHIFVTFQMVFLPQTGAQCNGNARVITGGSGEIDHPNIIGGEYNKSEDCTWSFSASPSGKDYALVLSVTKLRLFVVINRKKVCLGSYNLTINNEQIECDRFAGATDSAETIDSGNFCKAYYNSSNCVNTGTLQDCETQSQTSYPVTMNYYSDGRTDPNTTTWSLYFNVEYRFIECQETTTATPATAQGTTTTKKLTTLSSTNGVRLTTSASTPDSDNTTIIIAASAGGGGLVLLLVIILVICICKRRQKTGKSTQEISLRHQNGGTKGTRTDQSAPVQGNANPAYQSGASEYETLDKARQSVSNEQNIEAVEYAATGGVTQTDQSGAEMYTTVDLAHKNNQSGGRMHDTLNVVPGPTQPGSELYDRLGEANTTGQSGAVTYDKLGGVSLPDQSGVEMYSTVGGAHETDQSGGDTYDRWGGAIQTNQSEPAMYSTVDTPQSVTQSSQPPSGHLTVSDQPEGVMYAAVSIKKKGVKETIHYNKESVDNVLYGTADDAK